MTDRSLLKTSVLFLVLARFDFLIAQTCFVDGAKFDRSRHESCCSHSQHQGAR